LPVAFIYLSINALQTTLIGIQVFWQTWTEIKKRLKGQEEIQKLCQTREVCLGGFGGRG